MRFIGEGLNGASFLQAIKNSFHDYSGVVPPFGASWPFVRLSIDKDSVEFKMPYIRKSALSSDVTVSLGKGGVSPVSHNE